MPLTPCFPTQYIESNILTYLRSIVLVGDIDNLIKGILQMNSVVNTVA